jgi:hypothetical protein
MVVGLLVTLFLIGITVFAVGRSIRIWRDREHFERVVARSSFYPFKKDVRRGLERGWVPFSASLVSLTLSLPIGILSSAHIITTQHRPVWLLVGLVFLILFLLGEVLQLTITWFNRPHWCVPPYLRVEKGAWSTRRSAKP